MEEFIERSNALITARPRTTRISTRYTHKKVAEGGDRVDPSAKAAKFVIKTYDPRSGMLYKYKVKKVNELSRILASLGPQSFEFEQGRKRGAASIMGDTETQDAATEAQTGSHSSDSKPAVPANESESPDTSKSKKKKAKKAKK